jgi:hypothetical protein
LANRFRRLLDRLSPVRRLLGSTGVRAMGSNALVVTIDARSYWVSAQRQSSHRRGYRVVTSDIRDITDVPTVVAAPPAPAAVVPEVQRRIEAHFARTRDPVTYL